MEKPKVGGRSYNSPPATGGNVVLFVLAPIILRDGTLTLRSHDQGRSVCQPTFAAAYHSSMKFLFFIPFTLITFLFGSCQEKGTPSVDRYIMDPHSAARPEEAVITHLDLDIKVDMDSKRIEGTASYVVRSNEASHIVLDTDGLEILEVSDGNGSPTEWELGDSTFLGRPLKVALRKGSEGIKVTYRTTPGAKALQWLSPIQTADGTHPFLFTQGQAILTRTWIPIQDSPGIRLTYSAKVSVPSDLMAVMSASNPQQRNADGVYEFRMDQPIPAYLIALAVGDLEFRSMGPRTGVYAERSMADKAAWEFADTERMLEVAESLYGPYRWERYDIIVLPPSFPFGGMENPRLTFATPTIIAGDRSLTALIAHEMAHSWSGNLVTNATWNDFWLNEGFTVYFENRICEAVYGKDFAQMHHLLGHQDLVATVDRLSAGAHPEDTHLHLDLEGRDPDEGMTDVAYEKGFAFLRLIEEKVGREKFDAFLRGYFDRNAFHSMTTERFLDYLNNELLLPAKVKVNISEWVDGPGIPSDIILPTSERFVKVEQEVERWSNGTPAKELNTKDWTTHEWLHFLRGLPADLDERRMSDLDNAFGFTGTGNSEILAAWLEHCIAYDHESAFERLDQFLSTVGRRKFLVPLYRRMQETEKGRIMAQDIYAHARPNYHSVSVNTLDELLKWQDNKPPVAF